MIVVKNLTKVYKTRRREVRALNNVSFTLPDTGMVCIVGKSGSGKSTLLNMISGLDSFDSGEIFISGQKTAHFRGKDFDSYRNTLVGFIFQEYNVLEEFTVGANIALALELQGRHATDAEIGGILDEVDLAGYGARRPNELSGGMKARVSIARALAYQGDIYLFDEPFSNLDESTAALTASVIKSHTDNALVLAVMHNVEFARKIADSVIVFDETPISSVRFI